MPIHDWTRVDAGVFHHFHHEWISEIGRSLNHGLLPQGYYALAEQIAGRLGPDVLTLQAPPSAEPTLPGASGAVVLADAPPKVPFRKRTELDHYAEKAKVLAIRHVTNHEVIALVEVVSPGNKSSKHGLRSFVEKAEAALRAGIHLLIVDLFPPTRRDPQGIHKAIWDQFEEDDFALPPGQDRTAVSYLGGPVPEAFIEPFAVHSDLPEMPLFLTAGEYVPVPLQGTYQAAWEDVPRYWRNVLAASP